MMNKYDGPIYKEVVLIGGGHSHVHVIKMLGMNPIPGVRVTLISRDFETPYSGMLPGYVAGFYTKEECHIDLVRLCAFANARLIHEEASGIDTKKKLIYFKTDRPPIRYNILAIDIGITPKPIKFDTNNHMQSNTITNTAVTTATSMNAITADINTLSITATTNTATAATAAADVLLTTITAVKPIDSFAKRWEHILAQILSYKPESNNNNNNDNNSSNSNNNDNAYNIVIVGGGVGGIELAFAIHYRIQCELKHQLLQSKLTRSTTSSTTSSSTSTNSNKGNMQQLAQIKVSIVTRGNTVMNGHSTDAAEAVLKLLKIKNINVVFDAEVVNAINIPTTSTATTTNTNTNTTNSDINNSSSNNAQANNEISTAVTTATKTKSVLITKNNKQISYDQVFWCIDAAASPWLQKTGLSLTTDGFIQVNPTLESINTPHVFASGDCCHIIDYPRPKAGVFAVRAGPPLLNNIKRKLFNMSMEDWIPQSQFLGIIGE